MEQQHNEAEIKHYLTIDIPNSYRDATNFSCELFRLIRKADPHNQYKLEAIYPNHLEAWRRYERIEFCRNWEELPDVGSIIQLERKVMGAEVGCLGVVYERYCLGEEEPTGVGIIFSNGDYDGFSRDDLRSCGVVHTGKVDRYAKYYRFENVITLTEDFRRGLFGQAFEQGV